MSQFAHSSQLLRELQTDSSHGLPEVALPDGEGSILLDSINAYLRMEDDTDETLTQFPEDPYEPEFLEGAARHEKKRERVPLSPIPAVDESNFEPPFFAFEAEPQERQLLGQEESLLPIIDLEIGENQAELVLSQYNKQAAREIQEDCLLPIEEEEIRPANERSEEVVVLAESKEKEVESPVVELAEEIIPVPAQPERNEQREENLECPSIVTNDPLVPVVEEQLATTEAISNLSANSTQIISLVPMDYLCEERCLIEPIFEQSNKEEPNKEPEVEYMDIEYAAPCVEIPQNNYIDVDAVVRMEIPMDIESIGFRDPPQPEVKCIVRMEPIEAGERQEWGEEQEILDNMSAKSIIEQLNELQTDKVQEFTFGKTDLQEVPEESPLEIEIIQNEIVVEPVPSQPQVLEIAEDTNHNLSLQVEHDNNFIDAMRDFQESVQPNIKEQVELKANPELSRVEIEEREASVEVQELVMLQHIEERNEERSVNQVVQIDASEEVTIIEEKEQEKTGKTLQLNQVCSLSIGSEEKVDHSMNRNGPQIIIQNDLSSRPSFSTPVQENLQSFQAPPSNHSFPTINVTFKDNQMNVNIIGPAFSYERKNLMKSEVSVQPELKECVSCHKVEKPVQPQKSMQSAITVRREASPPKLVTVQKQIMTDSIVKVVEQVDNSMEQYNLVITASQTYLLNFSQFSQVDHKNFEKTVNQYVLLRFTPEPKTELGVHLFKDGLFLIALVKLTTRHSATPFIFSYMYEYLESAYGNSITKNHYVFKCECEKAKASYEAALEKKFIDVFQSKIPVHKEQPIVRRNMAESTFFSIRCDKKDESSQVTPKKIPPEPVQDVINKSPAVSPIERKVEAQKQTKDETPKVVQATVVDVKPALKMPTQVKEESADRTDKEETYKQERLKKSIEEIKAAYGSGLKKVVEQSQKKEVVQPQAPNRFSELYQKYRKIKESTTAEPSALKHLSPVLKTDNKDEGKKATKKQVVFNDEVIVSKDSVQMQESEQQVARRRKKKKGSRSKRDNSLDSPDEGVGNRRRTNSKK